MNRTFFNRKALSSYLEPNVMKKIILPLLAYLLLAIPVPQAQCTQGCSYDETMANCDGNWSDSDCWVSIGGGGPCPPGGAFTGDCIEINGDVTVNIDVDLTTVGNSAITITVEGGGGLIMGNNNELSLLAGSEIVLESGTSISGGSANSAINIGAMTYGPFNAGNAINGPVILTESGLVPVELADFFAIPTSGMILITWHTFTEINNDYFSLEKSENAHDWTEITQISSAGSGVDPQSYSYFDEHPSSKGNYYRLKQTDFDGTYTYSHVVFAAMEKGDNRRLMVADNGGKAPQLTSLWDQDQLIEVYSASGQKMGIVQLKAGERKEFDFDQGLYFLFIEGQTQKVLVTR